MERLLAAGANVNAVANYGRGLGAGRVNPDFTQICQNLGSEYYSNIFVSICLNFKLIEIVVGCSGIGR